MDKIKYDPGSGVPDEWGDKMWLVNGQLHRTDGPAIEYAMGTKKWYINGKRHREDGPAIEYPNGTKKWMLNNEYHREDGPAIIESPPGTKEWYINGKRHREDGPAIEWANGKKKWYLNGKRPLKIYDQKIIVGKSIEIGESVGIVIEKINNKIYKILLGNQKIVIKKCQTK